MRILAYTYIAAYHCIDCARVAFAVESPNKENPDIDENDIPIDQVDDEGSSVHPIFDFDDSWELDPDFITENPTQHLACEDCHKILASYTVTV